MASTDPLPIDRRTSRTLERLDTLFEIGRAAGTNRPGLGAGEPSACELVAGWMHEAGLEVSSDAGGNLLGRGLGGDPGAREVWSGSHHIRRPTAAASTARWGRWPRWMRSRRSPRPVAPPARSRRWRFGWRRGRASDAGCFGSRAMVGELPADEADLRDADGTTLGEAFAALGLGSLPREGWLGSGPAAFVELHIEQGPTLAELGAPLGVVTSIAGMAGYELHVSRPPRPRRNHPDAAARRCARRRCGICSAAPGLGRREPGSV